jgi:hypothetical protein
VAAFPDAGDARVDGPTDWLEPPGCWLEPPHPAARAMLARTAADVALRFMVPPVASWSAARLSKVHLGNARIA